MVKQTALLIFLLAMAHNCTCHVYSVILAGGTGERLWPLSRADKPKQLLSFDEKTTFLHQAINRINQCVPQENIFVCTTAAHEKTVKESLDNAIKIIVEPAKRDTGPAILCSCMHIQQHDPEAIILFSPSDQYIPQLDDELFATTIQAGIDFIHSHDQIVLFGVKPIYASTEYGYIEFNKQSADQAPFKITAFHEKPTAQYAQQFVTDGMLWNQCMFAAKVSVFIDEFKKYAPDVVHAMQQYIDGDGSYEEIRSISVDFAIMEKSEKLWVIPCDYQYADIGTIDIFLTLKQQLGLLNNSIVECRSTNNLVDVPDTSVVLLGVENLCIIKTKDIFFIGNRDELCKMRELIAIIKRDENMRRCL